MQQNENSVNGTNKLEYAVIVIGGGHAGVEAAAAAARMGAKTLLLTHKLETIGHMSCNPSIGGIGKSHLVKEIDALDGIMAKATDQAGIHFRILNASKGPAVRATRAQTDRQLYKQAVQQLLRAQSNLTILEHTVEDLLVNQNKINGVITASGTTFTTPTVILALGTFLNGLIHIGDKTHPGGRISDPATIKLATALQKLQLTTGRLKTGTPPRLDAKSIDYSKMQPQPTDQPLPVFSFLGTIADHPPQVCCHITRTNSLTHDIIKANLSRSPLYSGTIVGTGPRYCPSIEDKVVRFGDKSSHQIFIEPEGLNSNEVYPNGISTSLPIDIQTDLVHSISGCENAIITQPGYAIEYDFFDPMDLKFSLEHKRISGLFLAGQINGSTGYEEAAAQGLLAGINAALLAKNAAPWWPQRSEAYLGVMIDDLITHGTKEPYRMFTSRAEYRLLLREDNADLRLTAVGYKLGVVGEIRYTKFQEKCTAIDTEYARLKNIRIKPNTPDAQILATMLGRELDRDYSIIELLRCPDINLTQLNALGCLPSDPLNQTAVEQIIIQVKYAGYIAHQETEITRQNRQAEVHLPPDLDYHTIHGLSNELKQKLDAVKPIDIAHAKRIPGITPAAISILLIHLKKRQRKTSITDTTENLATQKTSNNKSTQLGNMTTQQTISNRIILGIYTTLLYLLLPVFPIRLFWLSRKLPAYKDRWQERFAHFNHTNLKLKQLENDIANNAATQNKSSDRPEQFGNAARRQEMSDRSVLRAYMTGENDAANNAATQNAKGLSIWVHAVSLGEATAAIALIKRLQKLYPHKKIIVTTTTPTGANKVQQAFADQVTHLYFPYDYPNVIKKFLRYINPRILIIMETELWPNLLHQCAKQQISVILANARLSIKSFNRYKLIPSLTHPMLAAINMVASQSTADAQRFLALGLAPEKSLIAGNIKFDMEIEPSIHQKAGALRTSWGKQRPVWIAASTHESEEEKVLIAAKKILAVQPTALLVLVPRHPERFDDVHTLCQKHGFTVARYSKNQSCTAETNIVLGDVIGQLLMFYATSDVAFVGGSFISLGGHNLLEPAAFAKPILSGPNLQSFVDISNLLLKAQGLIIVDNEVTLAEQIIKLLNDKHLSKQYGTAAYNVVAQNRGATQKIINLITQILSGRLFLAH